MTTHPTQAGDESVDLHPTGQPPRPEDAYRRLGGYRFAARYAEERSVADISLEELGYGTRLLAETANSVEGLSSSPETVERASQLYGAVNVGYTEANLPGLPAPENSFDTVVALEVIEHLEDPEGFVREAKRVLKEEGILVISTPDRQAFSNERNPGGEQHLGEMYASEFRKLLARHFKNVQVYRHGTVAGGFVFRDSRTVAGAQVENVRLSTTDPYFSQEPPAAHFILAVCTDAGLPEREKPYLLLDHDRRVFEEYEDLSEDVELVEREVKQLQETEVQAFVDARRFLSSEISYLRALHEADEAQLKRYENQAQKLQNQLQNIQSSRTWRMLGVYRSVRIRLARLLESARRIRKA